MIAEAWDALLGMSLATSALAALLLLVRLPLRRSFGARITYLAWQVVPFAALALLLPGPAAPPVSVAALHAGAAAAAGVPAEAFDVRLVLIPVWLLGVLGVLAFFVIQQLRYGRRLGRPPRCIDAKAGILRGEADMSGPAVIGFWQPRIVLPRDFEARWSPAERELVLAHEQVHLERGDTRVNAVATFLRALNWFNPLIHYAAGRMRIDQELACDAAVLARFPQARRRYAEAMLKTQLAAVPNAFPTPPAGCHWTGTHVLKERIAMLKHPLPSRALQRAGVLAITVFAGVAACVAWAAQPAQPAASSASPAGYARLSPPQHPVDASGNPLEGMVLLRVRVGTDGSVLNVSHVRTESAEPVSGDFAKLVEASSAAVLKWKFQPSMQDGKAVESEVIVPVKFASPKGGAGIDADRAGVPVLDEINVGGG